MQDCKNSTLKTCPMKKGKIRYHPDLYSGNRYTVMMKTIQRNRFAIVYKRYTLFYEKTMMMYYRRSRRYKEKKWLFIHCQLRSFINRRYTFGETTMEICYQFHEHPLHTSGRPLKYSMLNVKKQCE